MTGLQECIPTIRFDLDNYYYTIMRIGRQDQDGMHKGHGTTSNRLKTKSHCEL